MPFRFGPLEISWLGHDSFRISAGGFTLYIDPYQLQVGEPKADVVLVTHEHFDHCDPPSIQRIAKPTTQVVGPRVAAQCISKATRNFVEVAPGEARELGPLKIRTLPAYNINKFRDPARGLVFHPKQDGRVAYLLELSGVTVFHAGDSDFVEEFRSVKADVVLVPVSGVYVMTPQEAAEFVNHVKPKVAIPMHYGSIVATRREAEEFKARVSPEVQVVILEREL